MAKVYPVVIPTCCHCNDSRSVRLRRQIESNGRTDFLWYCLSCGRRALRDQPFLSQTIVKSWHQAGKIKNLEDIPLLKDMRGDYQCEVCGANEAEEHHWLPRAFTDLVPNHDAWPTSMLCKTCHDVWHEIVTPYLPGRGRSELGRASQNLILHFGGWNGRI